MTNKPNLFWPLCFGTAILFQAMFFKLEAGLNYGIYSILQLSILFLYIKPLQISKTFWFLVSLYCTITFAVIFAHTQYSIFIYWIISLMIIFISGYSQIKHLQLSPLLFISGLESLLNLKLFQNKKGRGNKTFHFIKFSILPLITILVLLAIYSNSNKMFAESLSWFTDYLAELFKKISPARIIFTIYGFVLTAIFIKNQASQKLKDADYQINNELIRKKRKNIGIVGLSKILLSKNKVAITTFVILNIMIAWLNYLDIQHIWLNFTWDGGLLKSMVHEGTYLLIFAILISIAITLFYLKSNLAFIKHNQVFQTLLILWLTQNMIMLISVWIRNTIYIEHFSLAYKRIFVYFFLISCFVGLMSIIIKILYKRSVDFIVTVNSFSVAAIFTLAACFNWDRIIAHHNFSNSEKSFVHFQFLADLNNSALPELIRTPAELEKIYLNQSKTFPFVKEREYVNVNYEEKIIAKKKALFSKWEHLNFLEWNYPEYIAYKKLKD